MSLRKAINAMCKDCIYDSKGGSGGWKQQVEECTSFSCPLYDLRPMPKKHQTQDISAQEGFLDCKERNGTSEEIKALIRSKNGHNEPFLNYPNVKHTEQTPGSS